MRIVTHSEIGRRGYSITIVACESLGDMADHKEGYTRNITKLSFGVRHGSPRRAYGEDHSNETYSCAFSERNVMTLITMIMHGKQTYRCDRKGCQGEI